MTTPSSPASRPPSQHQPAHSPEAQPHLRVESRPSRLIAARYDRLPFPMLGPIQEVAFDLGITAYHADITLNGLVFRGYAGHQLLFEQRWPARIIRQHTRESDLHIPANTGLAVRHLHFQFHGYEPLTMIEVTAVGKREDDEQPAQAVLQVPVTFYDQQTDLHFPLEGTWWAIQAADWSDLHKQEVFSQTYAVDFVKLGPDNRFFAGDGMNLEDHYSWNQPVYATAGGKVAYVCYDMPDMAPMTVADERIFRNDPRRLLGNAVAISHANGEFSYYGHLQQASLRVNQGQVVRRGTLLGYVGNSGHSPGPHLHFHLMNGPNLLIDQGLPVKFSHFWAGGRYYETLTTIPTRMIVTGPNWHNMGDTHAEG
ncbi:MAG TPA: M23 family metallopeptidase [Caldilineaceae bacterium]|nr:M23 family metallopeptidase [Caldilineaceae bacterium]